MAIDGARCISDWGFDFRPDYQRLAKTLLGIGADTPVLATTATAVTYRIAFGPRAGQKMLTLRGAMPREATARQPLCADIDGFSLHAAVRVEARDCRRLEQLCRYITRPALADERVQSTPLDRPS